MKKLTISFFIGAFSIISLSFTQGEAACNSYGYPSCTGFTDSQNHTYKESIQYVQEKGIVNGYEDGSYKPDSPINRAEFTKILLEAILGTTPDETINTCFPDVGKGMWFEKYVCYAKENNILNGYPDGTFQAGNNINFAEASKILINTFNFSHRASLENEEWYTTYIVALDEQNSIPVSIQKVNHLLTRGEMAEMIMRIKEKDTSRISLTACDLMVQLCPNSSFAGYGDEQFENIDMGLVRKTWLGWNNEERNKLGLHDYKYNNALNRTAYIWSEYSKNKGEITHKREGQTAYYDYNIITQWFKDLGVTFKNVNRVTYTENIGWGPFSCSDTDCTQKLLNNIRSTFDFYMDEKDKAYKPHYNSLMNQYFKEIGLGIVLGNGKYYLTVHYGTELL
jgi:uncharacterized protein YkwD